MEEDSRSCATCNYTLAPIPANYVSLRQLKETRMKEQEKMRKEEEERRQAQHRREEEKRNEEKQKQEQRQMDRSRGWGEKGKQARCRRKEEKRGEEKRKQEQRQMDRSCGSRGISQNQELMPNHAEELQIPDVKGKIPITKDRGNRRRGNRVTQSNSERVSVGTSDAMPEKTEVIEARYISPVGECGKLDEKVEGNKDDGVQEKLKMKKIKKMNRGKREENAKRSEVVAEARDITAVVEYVKADVKVEGNDDDGVEERPKVKKNMGENRNKRDENTNREKVLTAPLIIEQTRIQAEGITLSDNLVDEKRKLGEIFIHNENGKSNRRHSSGSNSRLVHSSRVKRWNYRSNDHNYSGNRNSEVSRMIWVKKGQADGVS